MVRAGAFKFELVEAETKLPFKEHHQDGKSFAEAEPGAEYYLSIQKMDKTETDVCLSYDVDGTSIDCELRYGKKAVDKTPCYKGIRTTHENGTSTHTALEFMKPKFSAASGPNSNIGMGSVQIKVYELHYTGRIKEREFKQRSKSFEAATVAVDSAVASKKKNLRSGVGTATITKHKHKMKRETKKGKHLDTITLHYCAALGLIEVGVIPKPDAWAHHRMKFPAKADSNPGAVDAKPNQKVVDLSVLDSDDE